MTLTPQQQTAASAILQCLSGETDHTHTVLAGHAGTGKTYTVGHIVQALVDKGYSIHLAAHAHTAVAQLRAALPADTRAAVCCSTIFSALGWRFSAKSQAAVESGAHRLSGVDVVVVDESSMVDDRMFDSFFSLAARCGLRMLWVGDPAQLPPVDPGNHKARSPVFARVQDQHRLSEVVRQAEGSPIIRASMYVRECLEAGTKPDVGELAERAGDAADGSSAVSIATGGVAAVADYTQSAVRARLDARAIAFRNKTVDAIGRMVAAALHPQGAHRLVAGDPVTFGARYGERVPTNSNARVAAVSDGTAKHGVAVLDCLTVGLDLDGGERVDVYTPAKADDLRRVVGALKSTHALNKRLEKACSDKGDTHGASLARTGYQDAGAMIQQIQDEYADLRLLYSMTAHKAQGGTFDVAIIDWRDMQSCSSIETMCRLLYVAVTRPAKYLVIVA